MATETEVAQQVADAVPNLPASAPANPGATINAVASHDLTNKLIDGVLAGGTGSTLALLLGVALVTLACGYMLYRQIDRQNKETVGQLRDENKELRDQLSRQDAQHESRVESLRAAESAKAQQERDRAEVAIATLAAKVESQHQQLLQQQGMMLNEYRTALMQTNQAMNNLQSSLTALRDTILAMHAERAFNTRPPQPPYPNPINPARTQPETDHADR